MIGVIDQRKPTMYPSSPCDRQSNDAIMQWVGSAGRFIGIRNDKIPPLDTTQVPKPYFTSRLSGFGSTFQ